MEALIAEVWGFGTGGSRVNAILAVFLHSGNFCLGLSFGFRAFRVGPSMPPCSQTPEARGDLEFIQPNPKPQTLNSMPELCALNPISIP